MTSLTLKGWVPTIFHRGSNWAYFGGYEVARRFLTRGNEGKMSPLASIVAGKFYKIIELL